MSRQVSARAMNDSLELSPLPAGISPHPQFDQENLNAAMSEADMLGDMGSPGGLSPMKLGTSMGAKPRPPALANSTNSRRESVQWLQNLVQWGSPKSKQPPCSPSRAGLGQTGQTLGLGVPSPMGAGRESMLDFMQMEQESARDAPPGTEAGSYLKLIDSCITPLNAQGPSRTCNESDSPPALRGTGVPRS